MARQKLLEHSTASDHVKCKIHTTCILITVKTYQAKLTRPCTFYLVQASNHV